MEFSEGCRGRDEGNEIKSAAVPYGETIEYELPSAKLLSIGPDAVSTMDGYG